MTLALYRKYRPRTFAEVIGQEHVTEPLMQALRSDRLNHAYLFSGPRGCGKTSSARILARSLNCEQGPTPEPCGKCDSCLSLAPDGAGSVDVIEIDAASHGGVDDARELRERAVFAPVASRFKVYIIDEAHMVSTQGFNALLKLVEEPPEYVKFVFATTEPEKVLGTIRSRTHHYPFRLIPPSVLRPYLEELCQREAVQVEPAVFPLVVRAGGGSARDSLSVLDQLIAGAGHLGVTYARAVSLLGVTDVALIDEMTDALAAGDGATAYTVIDRVADAGHDSRRYAADLLERFRDLIVLQKVPDAAASGIIEAPQDQLDRMISQAERMGPATLSRLADLAHNGLTEMRGTTAPRLLLELIIARMLLPGADDSHSALLQRLERIERRFGAASPADVIGSDAHPAHLARPGAAAGRTTPTQAPPADDASGSAPRPNTERPATARTSTERMSTERATTGSSATERAATERAGAERATPDRVPSGHTTTDRQAADGTGTGHRASSTPSIAESDSPGQHQVRSAEAPPSPAERADGASAGSLDAAAVRRIWDEVLTVVRRHSPRAWAVVREAMVRDVHGEEIVLVFQHAVHANMFGAQADLLVEAIGEVLGGSWRVRAELGGDQNPRSGATGRSGGSTVSSASTATAPMATASTISASTVPAPTATAPARAPSQLRSDGTPPTQSARSAPQTRSTSTNATSSNSAFTTAPPTSDNDWPEPARPGGVDADTAVASAPAPLRSVKPVNSRANVRGGEQSSTTSARGARGSAGRRTDSGLGAAKGTASSDGGPADEPPFDPEYDRGPAGGYIGFDPGDEPLDDAVDPAVARQTSEQQAVKLLAEQFGAERIGDPPSRN